MPDETMYYGLSEKQKAVLANNFVYHAPKPGQPEKYETLRTAAGDLAETMMRLCPESRELSTALTNLETAAFWANASIARNE